MPINWEEFDNDLEDAAAVSAEKTDKKLASKISSLTHMTDDEIQVLFPAPADVKNLAKLMAIVKSSEDKNTKLNKLVSNAEDFSGVVLTLLNKFV